MQPARPGSLIRTAATDARILAIHGVAVAVILWLLYGPGDVAVDTVVRAPVGVIFNLMLLASSIPLARRPGRARSVRRFWRALTVMGVLLLVGNLGRLVVTLQDPGAGAVPNGRFQDVCVLSGIAILVATALAHPHPKSTRQARVQYWLDASAVMTASAVVIWFMVDRSSALGIGTTGSAPAIAIALAVAFAVTRLTVSGHNPMNAYAASPLIVAALIECFNVAVLRATVGAPVQLALQIVTTALVCIGPRLQVLADRLEAENPGSSRRSWSRLPYAMLGVVLLILPASLPGRLSGTALVTFGGLFVITGLVVVRQWVAFRENSVLVRTLSLQEERVRLMLEYSTDITSLIDATGAMVYLTPATRTLGYEPAEMIGVRVVTMIHPDDLPALLPDLQRLMATPGSSFTYQARYRHANGSWIWLEVTSRNLTHLPSVGAVVSNARDVTESRELQDRLRHQATHDALTGLANRVLFGERLAAQVDAGVALLHVDLDGFKPINDTYGHHTGDVVLVRVAERLRAVLPADAVPARLGGDEFAVLLPGAGGPAAEQVADRFRAALTRPIEVDGHLLRVAASIGVVAGAGVDPDALMREADEAMYRVKNAARGERRLTATAAYGRPARSA
ncbi:sensor domain-containing diguanylate cyclase [Actinoplanes sp. NPDC026623]|uniref:sensor domain-containing diguanylate cyclase n=1 Tax=Actinoplanes sp. NPDC026623 TaxID=3155610 RepID=UPI0033CAE544